MESVKSANEEMIFSSLRSAPAPTETEDEDNEDDDAGGDDGDGAVGGKEETAGLITRDDDDAEEEEGSEEEPLIAVRLVALRSISSVCSETRDSKRLRECRRDMAAAELVEKISISSMSVLSYPADELLRSRGFGEDVILLNMFITCIKPFCMVVANVTSGEVFQKK